MLEVVLTPTYSGCPATEVIERSVVEAIRAADWVRFEQPAARSGVDHGLD